MKQTDLKLAALRARIHQCDPAHRHQYHPELRRLINRTLMSGGRVPAEVRSLENRLAAEAAEALFDNMPV